MSKLVELADQYSHSMCTDLVHMGMGADEAVQVATMMLVLVKRCHPQPDNVLGAMQKAEAELQAFMEGGQ